MIFNRPRRREKKSTWVFNSKISQKTADNGSFSVRFTCNNETYTGIEYKFMILQYSIKYLSNSGSVSAYSNKWNDEAYRTVTFDEEPTGDLLAFLEANATPQ